MELREKLIRLAHEKPELRVPLLPILREAGKTAASLEEGSDEYFGQMVRPLITKSEMTRALKPHGFAPRGKGSFDRKRNQVSLLIDPLKGRGGPIQIWLNGSHYTANDGMWDISGKSPHGTIEDAEKFTGNPKKDAKAMLKGLADLMANQAYYDKEWGTKSAAHEKTAGKSYLDMMRAVDDKWSLMVRQALVKELAKYYPKHESIKLERWQVTFVLRGTPGNVQFGIDHLPSHGISTHHGYLWVRWTTRGKEWYKEKVSFDPSASVKEAAWRVLDAVPAKLKA